MGSYLPFNSDERVFCICLLAALRKTQALANPQPADDCPIFADETAAATGWIHFLVMDCLWTAGFIGKDRKRVSGNSLALCCFAVVL